MLTNVLRYSVNVLLKFLTKWVQKKNMMETNANKPMDPMHMTLIDTLRRLPLKAVAEDVAGLAAIAVLLMAGLTLPGLT